VKSSSRLVGREAERAQLDQLLARARRGHSGVLVLRGEPGIGKSALLDYAVERADGMEVLRTLGLESASELPFVALADLLRPALGHLDRLPKSQAEALNAALALGSGGQASRYPVAAATLSLIAAEAEETPVLCAIDDAHWVDRASAESLVFTARRLDAEGVVMLFAARTGEGAFEAPGLPELELGGLPMDAARALLARTGRRVGRGVGDRLAAETAGNPLALLELSSLLSERQLAGHEPLDTPLPAGARVEAAFLRRTRVLSREAQLALLLAAASDSEDLALVVRAGQLLALPAAALEGAAAAGLIRLGDGRLSFQHPLVRAAVYQSAAPKERWAVHRALAGALDAAADADRRAWHLAAAAEGPDADVAAELERTAESARLRGGVAAEADALERAARLTPDGEARGRRFLRAARAAWRAGNVAEPAEMLDEALPKLADPLLRADAQELRAEMLKRLGDAEAAHELLLGEAARLETIAPRRAARMLTQASHLHFRRNEGAPALELAERACRLAGPGVSDDLELAGTLAWALAYVGRSEEARALALHCAELSEATGETANGPQIAWALAWLEEYDVSRRLIERFVRVHREAGALPDLAYALFFFAELEFRTGRFTAAYAAAQESVRLAEQTGRDLQVMASLAVLAAVEAVLGRADDARRHATHSLALAGTIFNLTFVCRANAALGLLELTNGRPREAVPHLKLVRRAALRSDNAEPSVLEWMPDLVEAYVRTGREDDALELLDVFEGHAGATDRAWALGASARYRGLLAEPDEVDLMFGRACAFHERTQRPFERARTELVYGERLRRDGRRAEARPHLRSALEIFERACAVPWAERARAELRATGETARKRDPTVVERLTPQELQVALAIGEGRTNREAAAALFLSPKTIEYHLHNVYRKLDVRSRVELARLLALDAAAMQPV
jgi:DNA-binding CsgD family transcriptional regulator